MTALNKASFAERLSCLLPELSQQATLYVAYSGGVDSSVLLHLAAQYATENQVVLKALHVNHGVSENAHDWQHFCVQQCGLLKIECLAKQLDLSHIKASFEQTARDQRYQFFAEHVTSHDVLMTAHHQDDQIETVLMRLFRGSGVQGLAGIIPSRKSKGMRLIRPLLSFDKQILIDFALSHHIEWVEDASNGVGQYDRNLIRLEILPAIKAAFPTSGLGIAKASEKAFTAKALLDEFGGVDLAHCVDEQRVGWFDVVSPLSWLMLSKLSDERILNTIDRWLQQQDFNYSVPRARLLVWLGQLKKATNKNHPLLVHEGRHIQYAYGYLHLLTALPEAAPDNIVWDISKPLNLPELDLAISTEPEFNLDNDAELIHLDSDTVTVTWRQGGERIRQSGRQHTQSFKKCLQENNVVHWERKHLPMIVTNDKLIWSGALGRLSYKTTNSKGEAIKFVMRKLNC